MTSSDKLISIAKKFPVHAMPILGDVMLDEYIWGRVMRISPEAPVPVVEAQRVKYTPVGAGNVAVNIAALGGKALLGGVAGPCQRGKQLHKELSDRGIDASGLQVEPDRVTTTKSRIVAHNQQVARVDSENRNPISKQTEAELLAWFETSLQRADVCLLSDYAFGVISAHMA